MGYVLESRMELYHPNKQKSVLFRKNVFPVRQNYFRQNRTEKSAGGAVSADCTMDTISSSVSVDSKAIEAISDKMDKILTGISSMSKTLQ